MRQGSVPFVPAPQSHNSGAHRKNREFRAALRIFLAAAAAAVLATPATAQVIAVDPAVTEPRLETVIDFEAFPPRAEPGWRFDQVQPVAGAWIGEAFAGQTTHADGVFDRIIGMPDTPLAVRPGAAGRNLAVAHHRGFGSNAVFALGPVGFDAIEGRGEGALAVLFPVPQRAVALKVHGEYPDPLGARTVPSGSVRLAFYRADGTMAGEASVRLVDGVNRLAFATASGTAQIIGLVITTDDPGGIALDDIRYSRLEELS